MNARSGRWLLAARPALIFAQGRSGSTLLGDLLARHPLVRSHDEALAAPLRWGLPPAVRVEVMRWTAPRHLTVFHVKVYQLTGVHRIADPGRWLRRMHHRGWRILWLRRENRLRQALSTLAGFAGDGFVARGEPGHHGSALTVDVAALMRALADREAAAEAEQRALAGLPRLELVYEADLADDARWPETMRRVFGYLGLPPVPVGTDLRRQHPGPLPSLIANYAEVAAALRGSPWERFLD